jgi:hypothetical protein
MSIWDELLDRARKSAIDAVKRAGKPSVVAVLKDFGVERVGDIALSSLAFFIEQAEALKAAPTTFSFEVKFKVGEQVEIKGGRNFREGQVRGYEVRYIVDVPGLGSHLVFRADRLESKPEEFV